MSDLTCDCCGTDGETDERDGGTATSDGDRASIGGEPARALERPIPEELGGLAATAYGMETTPETLGDWAEDLRMWAGDQGILPLELEDLCHTSASHHVLELDGETHHFACVIDPLMVPGVIDYEELVVRSASPLEGAEIEIRIEAGEIKVTPSTAVLSLGAAHSIEQLDGDEFAPEEAYTQLCAYGNAFPNRTTYEVWAEATPEAATMAISMVEGVELARALTGDR